MTFKVTKFALASVVLAAAPAAAEPLSSRYDASIQRLAQVHGVPERLIRRVIMRESRYVPHLTNGGHYGLMQIKLQTAKGMGYGGGAGGLLDGETNLTYAVPYLANAYVAAEKNEDRAVALYAGGYYYVAKRKGLLTRLRTARSEPLAGEPASTVAYAETPRAPEPQASSPFAFLFTPPQQPAQTAEAGAEEAQPEFEMVAIPRKFARAPLPPVRPEEF